ncbi:MAG: hypothetical protein HOF69_00055 [Campylobacteraceae bacterium]|jgi:hypothetical protein|nr:hypothetical protein [Campylobacteraceae bacterium]MBT3881636.1 hypothetical protein [Campylobacteraceae bacterium]MBT4030838.1 hypothetical protein [Campylobacteraceae bacterium]MBT4572587.1 hypothetical protein [Campylobacteraceae bacterium]MBT4708048.1 hypothetical protein [Campylobacteraceae bacterium]
MTKVEIEKPDEFLKLVESKKSEYLYHDHPSDGLDLFTDEIMESYGWHAVSFDFITYRSIAEFIEENCAGTFTFNDHPMGFNGFAVVDNIEEARAQVKAYIIDMIKSNLQDDYDDDQQEALEFFDIAI